MAPPLTRQSYVIFQFDCNFLPDERLEEGVEKLDGQCIWYAI
jgi:hypothetical protein